MEFGRVNPGLQRSLTVLLLALWLNAHPVCGVLYDACQVFDCPKTHVCQAKPGFQEYQCLCQPGFNCTTNECDNDPCPFQNAQCSGDGIAFTCKCRNGFSGPKCEPDVSACNHSLCGNNSQCTEAPGGYTCLCQPGYTGQYCETALDKCASNPCQNEAICLDKGSKYMCFCVPGFQGHHCEIDINECASSPCQNNGTCLNLMDQYECQCATGYKGDNCETEIDECQSNPCQNGATCRDYVGYFSCECPAGYDGETCQHDIDECQSHPCLNGGVCQDAINRFYCNCSDTGFEGDTCDVDILECASNPCVNNATCLEGVKAYNCLCWPGYSGKNCELDINECAEHPCLHNGLCLERSNKSFYGTEPEFNTEFSYLNSSGYVCRCQPGFSGENCFINIDECEPAPCQNGGTCIDLINDFQCQCALGYTGGLCAVNIDDCAENPCENEAICRDGVADYTCICPDPLPGGVTWGGKNCSVVLEGCLNHSCQNEAICIPKYEQEIHSYTCKCLPGFYGENCSIPTTFSFTSSGYILYDMIVSNTSNRRMNNSTISLRFRTTLPNMVLMYLGDENHYLILEIFNGLLQVGFRNYKSSRVIIKNHRVDDGYWYKAEVNLDSFLELRVTLGHECSDDLCTVLLASNKVDKDHLPESFATVYIGGLTQDSLLNNTLSKLNFTGCIEDLAINSKTLIPQNIKSERYYDMELGCNKTDWCHPNPCHHESACVDQWTNYKCECSRPYMGPSCLQEYVSGTFFQEAIPSYATFTIGQDTGESFNVSAFIKTLKPDGLLLHISNSRSNYFTMYLKSGHICITVNSTKTVSYSEYVTNGQKHMIIVSIKNGHVSVHGTKVEEDLGQVLPVSLRAQDTVLVGGMPPGEDVEEWGGYFKGCLQDVRINDNLLEFFPSDEKDIALYPGTISNVTKDCVSDDTCKSGPCKNDGSCAVTWNEFICTCSANFTGPTCEEPVWCQRRPCPEDSICQDIPGGYTCLVNATFSEQSPVVFTSNISSEVQLTSVFMDFRTRDTNAVLLHAYKDQDHISINIQDGHLHIFIQSGNSVEHVTFDGQIQVSDALWHRVTIMMKDPTLVPPQWILSFDNGDNIIMQGSATSLSFLVEDTPITLAENYTGCLGQVSIGGLYLPFADQSFPQKFIRKTPGLPALGCRGADVCSGIPCRNGGKCHDEFNVFHCECGVGWEGQHCEINIDDCKSQPCIQGICVDLVADYQCNCSSGYTGRNCDINVDDCQDHLCLNGGICLDGVNSYTCKCPANYTGDACQWPYPPDRCHVHVICLNGGKCNSGIWGANCTCRPGFRGHRCEVNIDDCEPNPCLNGGACQDSVNNFKCICNSSFSGVRCEKPRLIRRAQASTLVGSAIGTGMLFILLLVITIILITMRKKRATQGTYSPSRQEKEGARVEMWNVLKLPPTERLI